MKTAEDATSHTTARNQGLAFYTWQIADNKVYGDPYLADLNGMPAKELAGGVPVERILAIIVDEDRPAIAVNVHRAIVKGDGWRTGRAMQLAETHELKAALSRR